MDIFAAAAAGCHIAGGLAGLDSYKIIFLKMC